MDYDKNSSETVEFTKDQLLNELELTFIEGAVYETHDDELVKVCRTGKYWACDCEYLKSNDKYDQGQIVLMKDSELKKFIGWA